MRSKAKNGDYILGDCIIPEKKDTLISDLRLIFKERLRFDEQTLNKYSGDASIFRVVPKVVVYPESVKEIKELVKYVAHRKSKNKKLSITVRAGGTDMTGGPLNDSIICDISNLNRIKKIGDDYAVVEPGLFYRDLEPKLAKRNLFLPCYPASKMLCTVGGMVANNAGGEKTLKYGKTENYVLELKVIFDDGEEYLVKSLTEEELSEKLKHKNREGEVYRKLYALINKNDDAIMRAKPQISKNSTGYLLWNIWQKDKSVYNFPQIFLGSQGTLGVITEIKFRIVKIDIFSRMQVLYLYDLKNLAEIVKEILKVEPTSIESFDDKTLRLAIKYAPELAKLISKEENIVKFGLSFLSDFSIFVKNIGLPKLVVLVEFSSNQEIEIANKIRVLKDRLRNFDLSYLEPNQKKSEKYWTIRRQSFELLRTKIKGKQTVPFIDDFIVSPGKLNEFLPRINAILDQYENFTYTIAGHLGDGNFHIIPLMNMEDKRIKKIIPELSQKVYDLVLEFEGSISAEHNDGLIRSPYIKRMYGEEVFKLFEAIKKIFDRKNIFNPHKKTDGQLKYSLSKIKNDNEHSV